MTPRSAVLRVIRFRATHHYRHRDRSDDENRALFGALADPHPHDYRVEVTIAGVPDPESGFVVDLALLDRVLAEEITGPLDGKSLNAVIPAFREGTTQPSTEALARWIAERIRDRVPPPATLAAVRVWESEELGGEVRWEP